MDASFPPASLDTQTAIREEVLARFGTTEDPRLREIMLSLIRHLHAFVGETKITWAEWERAMAFFATAAGVTGQGRNEFIALSDSIGLSMQVLAASQPKPAGATIPTLIGPFFIDDAPVFAAIRKLLDGYEATRRIKADPDLKAIPIIVVTSYALSGDEAKARAAGCDAYVTKPYSPRQLLAKIREFLPA